MPTAAEFMALVKRLIRASCAVAAMCGACGNDLIATRPPRAKFVGGHLRKEGEPATKRNRESIEAELNASKRERIAFNAGSGQGSPSVENDLRALENTRT